MPKIKFSPSEVLYLVSACLAGVNCTFRGTNNLDKSIKKLVDSKAAIALCPEVFGALGSPRENIELVGGGGHDVLDGKARAITASGKDVTANVIRGAASILEIVRIYGIKEAILKSNSPSCGAGRIYDGTFSKKLKPGDGVLAALLKRERVKVITEKEV